MGDTNLTLRVLTGAGLFLTLSLGLVGDKGLEVALEGDKGLEAALEGDRGLAVVWGEMN